MKKDLIVKDNALINASYNLDLAEQRLILLAILEARESNTPSNHDLTIHAESYINHFNVHRNTAYKVLKDACKNLFERRFSYQKLTAKGNLENVMSRWVQRVSYVENEALVRIRFSDDVVPLITNLEKHFTSYELEQVSSLTSAYAIRLYELLIAWRSTGKVSMLETKELRSRLGVLDTEHQRMESFKRRVLEPAIQQINDHTDIKAEYEQHKRGRSIIGFSFSFKQKSKPKTVKEERDPNTPDFFIRMTDAQRHLFGNKLAHDARVQSEYSHLIGTGSYEDFAKLLADMLAEEQHFKMFYPLLVEHGYKA
ncbi:replication initiation protein RepM [Acinetobacter baumannii]|uniref:replication initiation protein RepM n=9 Tax=Acinetobacter TaxID=469 RepID=UPI001CB85E6F|nr:replication initiation protein RepM [Acinetobacter baumannii]MBZ0352021.1 replication initiation protein [Acinetobacter baumannii]MCG5905112.1 replication initiation protein RepM [Acinetobacter baumannii]MCG5976287.1 replication initiation protein RepM [Acinetobacter baumannii]HAV5748160.1 RepB family plasmid replication initiator protein [Acinetobacter baumannii]HAV5756083.1 RepB family plasmid replication initiator protein [Acinetobacter baumannii]